MKHFKEGDEKAADTGGLDGDGWIDQEIGDVGVIEALFRFEDFTGSWFDLLVHAQDWSDVELDEILGLDDSVLAEDVGEDDERRVGEAGYRRHEKKDRDGGKARASARKAYDDAFAHAAKEGWNKAAREAHVTLEQVAAARATYKGGPWDRYWTP